MKKFVFLIALCIASLSLFSQTTIYSENFSNGFPANYSQITSASDGGWLVGSANSLSSQSFPIDNQGSGSIIATNDDECNCNKSNDFLMTDTIDLGPYSGENIFLRFDKYFWNGSYQGNRESASVEISTNGGNSWTILKRLGGSLWYQEAINLSQYAGQQIMLGFRYSDGGGFLFGFALDNILLEIPNDYDMLVTSLNIPRYHKLSNGSVPIEVVVYNNGGLTVNSFDINYVVNGDTTTDNISGLNLNSLDDYTFITPTSFTPPDTGDYEFYAFASNINIGNVDQNSGNDTSVAFMSVYDTTYQRVPLYEIMTSSTCGPCRAGNINFEDVMSNYPNQAVSVKYQQDFPGSGDPYATSESVYRRRNFYGVNSVPRMYIDGGWDGNASAFDSDLHEFHTNVKPAFLQIEAEYKIWPDSQIVETCFTITALKKINNKTLYASINENKTTANVESNGETEFFNVFKKWFTDIDTMITIEPGVPFEICLNDTFKGSYRLPNNANDMINNDIEHSVEEFEDLNVAIWVQDDMTKEVFQAANAAKIATDADYSVGPFAVEDNTSISLISNEDLKISFYPNPAQNKLYLNYEVKNINAGQSNIRIYDQLGKLVKAYKVGTLSGNNTYTINTEDLSNGVYIIQLQSGPELANDKFIIQK